MELDNLLKTENLIAIFSAIVGAIGAFYAYKQSKNDNSKDKKTIDNSTNTTIQSVSNSNIHVGDVVTNNTNNIVNKTKKSLAQPIIRIQQYGKTIAGWPRELEVKLRINNIGGTIYRPNIYLQDTLIKEAHSLGGGGEILIVKKFGTSAPSILIIKITGFDTNGDPYSENFRGTLNNSDYIFNT